MSDFQPVSPLITSAFLEMIHSFYKLEWAGIHGYSHWCRVRENGLLIAGQNGANLKVIEYFAFCHDCQRVNEGIDPDHGRRASRIIRNNLIPFMDLSEAEIDILCNACDTHTDGLIKGDLTLETCWDSDRLDLMRAGIRPTKKHLCTDIAKQDHVLNWAIDRSLQWKNQFC